MTHPSGASSPSSGYTEWPHRSGVRRFCMAGLNVPVFGIPIFYGTVPSCSNTTGFDAVCSLVPRIETKPMLSSCGGIRRSHG